MSRIFISYSRKDEVFARRLATDLDAMGAEVWLDVDDIPAGMNWSSAIQEGLQTCEMMILILSPDSMASKNVANEWQYYFDRDKPILPVLLRPTEVHFQLSRVQYIDFTHNYDTALKQLNGQLRAKGLDLQKIGSDASRELPVQRPLPVADMTSSRFALIRTIALSVGLGLIIVAIIIANNVLNSKPTPTLSTGTVAALNVIPPTSEPSPTDMATIQPTIKVMTAIPRSETIASPTTAQTASYTRTQVPSTTTPTPSSTKTLITPTQTPSATQVLPTVTPTPSATNTRITPTQTPSATLPPSTATPDSTDTPISPTPLHLATISPFAPITTNYSWKPQTQTFDGVEMVLVPPGCFMMGSNSGKPDEKPVNKQCFTQPFWIDKYEVTQGQFKKLTKGANPSNFRGDDNRPVETITWFQALDFCQKQRDARLPTEAEWEYAARGPSDFDFPWGSEQYNIANMAIFTSNSYGPTAPKQPAEVGSRPAGQAWVGALDMAGNVWEWTSTIYDQKKFPYPYQVDDGRENSSNSGGERVQRGGAWNNANDAMRSAGRLGVAPTFAGYAIGFRCARSY